MWNNDDGDELNEDGRPVQLYLPVSTGSSSGYVGPSAGGAGGGTSYIGGQWTPPPPAAQEDDDQQHPNLVQPACDHCNENLWLLVQFDVPPPSQQQQHQPQCPRRTISVFGCPKQDCFASVKFNNGFSNGGQGVLKCIQHRSKPDTSDTVKANNVKSITPSAPPVKSSLYDNDDDDDDDWGLDNTKNDAAAQQKSLEDAVAAMEMGLDEHGSIGMAKSTKNKNSHSKQKQITDDQRKNISNNKNKTTNSFKCFRLKAQDEPMSDRPVLEDDDVGLSESDEKIRNMLARYMAEEDDEEILAALRGANNGGGGGASTAGGGGEEDERLTDEERILRGFQDRLRREPTQVLRRAKPNGTPLWSLVDKDRKSGRTLWSVPDCKACGCKLGFEFQLLPSILSTLEVDKYANDSPSAAATRNKQSSDDNENEKNPFDLDELLTTGMNFGSVAVFACDNADCPSSKKQSISDDVFLVIQESADEGTALLESRKKKKHRSNGHNQQQQPEDSNTRTTQMRELPQATMAIVEDLDDDDQFELDG